MVKNEDQTHKQNIQNDTETICFVIFLSLHHHHYYYFSFFFVTNKIENYG